MSNPVQDIGSSLVHTQERFRTIIFTHVSIAGVGAAASGAIAGLTASDTVVSVGPARAVDGNATRVITALARTAADAVSWTTVGAGIVGTINLSALVFSPSKVVV